MKSGFVSLIGRTNAGKSSLLNFLVGERLAMVSHKINATRRKINGIAMFGEDQIIFIDTPGLHKSEKIMNKLMIDVAIKSIGDADLVLFLASIHDNTSDYEEFLKISKRPPHILILTKTDETDDGKIAKKLGEYAKFCKEFCAIIPVNIKKKVYRAEILREITKLLPEHEYFFDPQIISNTNLRDIYRDFILESVYESVSSEIPYNSDVLIEKITEKEQITKISAKIITDTNSHKQILIGKSGETIKRIGIKSRKRISDFSKVKIHLNLQIFVKKGWKNDENLVKSVFVY